MSLRTIELEEEDRIQFEMQMLGQGGKKAKIWAPEPVQDSGPARVQSSENYILTLEKVTRK